MAFECLVPFLVASSFQNLHLAGLGDIGLGVNEDMLFLGAGFDLEPFDLVNIVHDKANTLNRHKIIELLNAGVINIDYISNFDRLCDLGFTITELCVLLKGSISVENVLVYFYREITFGGANKSAHFLRLGGYLLEHLSNAFYLYKMENVGWKEMWLMESNLEPGGRSTKRENKLTALERILNE